MFIILLICGLCVTVIGAPEYTNEAKEVQFWSQQFGITINRGSSESSCVRKLHENYNDKLKAKVKSIEATKLLQEFRKDINSMFKWKREAVVKIALEAERLASDHVYEKHMKFKFANAKRLVDSRLTSIVPSNATAMELSDHPNFGDIRVNTFHSAVQVPTNVFEESPALVNAIKWSEGLTQLFRNNLAIDPKLSWQYYASAHGFTRLYPAHKWRAPHGPRGELLDFFDARSRPWYIQAAAQPKDIVVLLDVSGSMTGSKRELAKNVVIHILESLMDDDFVNVLKFSSEVQGISDCFGNETLVPAIKPNLREFRDRLEGMNTSEIANFTLALTHAFELLSSAHDENMGAYCNQAIMIVTDGAPDNFESVFEMYNWPRIPIRVFTYLVGKEVTETHEANWMACHNRGYYTHVANLAEVREQVQQYIPVMSRPLVLSGNSSRPVVWTSAYSEVTYLPLTNWLWDERSKERIRATIRARISGSDKALKEPKLPTSVPLTTTIGVPVFDTKNTTKITVRVLIKNMMAEKEEEIRSAYLLGVAGVDVPISEIQKRIPPYKLGVNAYSFATTNNGMLLWHPDLRPLFQGLLKPYYNSVNLLQVELPDTVREPLSDILKDMLDRLVGWKKANVRVHFDSMKRVIARAHDYYYGPLEQSPFSLGISLPLPYGKYFVDAEIDVDDTDDDISQYFEGSEWYVHPDWVYCDAPITAVPATPEDTIRAFLAESKTQGSIQWKSYSSEPENYKKLTCEKALIQALVFDAKATKIDPLKCGQPKKASDYERELTSKFGIALTFISTRSGLTRFQDFSNSSRVVQEWKEQHKRSIDEDFYKRSVDYHYVNESSFVFSVAIDIGDRIAIVDDNVDQMEVDMQDAPIVSGPVGPIGQTPYGGFPGYTGPSGDTVTSLDQLYVTASRAIFVGEDKEKAPAAVAGALIKMSTFRETFFNLTLKCGSKRCAVKCEDETTYCLVVDNNGFILIAEDIKLTGKFLSEFDNILLESLITNQIYIRKRVTDYQAICVASYTVSGLGSRLLAPFKYIATTLMTLWTRILVLAVDSFITGTHAQDTVVESGNIESTINPTTAGPHSPGSEHVRRVIKKTRPKPCVREINLLQGSPKFFSKSTDTPKLIKSKCNACHQTAIVQLIPYTNLITIALVNACDCAGPSASAYVSRKRDSNNNEALVENDDKDNTDTEADNDEDDDDDDDNGYEIGQYKKLEAKTIAIAGQCSILSSFYRQRPKSECISSHPEEQNIKICGLAVSSLLPSGLPVVLSIIASGLTKVLPLLLLT